MLGRFEAALVAMQALDAQFPGEQTFGSIILQLSHVVECLKANRSPREPGKELNFGFLGMRFVREFDEALGGELAELADALDKTYPA